MTEFFFGAGGSAHQVEGNNVHSDWWEFEQNVLSKKGIHSGIATNHYELFDQDFKLAAELGHNAHRFSVEWAKIEPEEGKFDEKVIAHYHEVFRSLKKHKLKPFVTLWHFTFPLWFSKKGGFEKKENFHYFVRYCKYVAEQFKTEMEYVLVLNEPLVYGYYSYLAGTWPPQIKKYSIFKKVIKNLICAYKAVYKELKAINPNFKISFAKNNQVFSAERKYNLFDRLLTRYFHHVYNHYFLDKVKHQLDFIGLNYYSHSCVKADLHLIEQFCHYRAKSAQYSDLGWEIYPEGIYLLLKDLHRRYKKPLIITETGVADFRDKLRPDYIRDTLQYVFKAKDEGVNVFGYIHWALTDNFEWAEGFEARFGLIEVDYKTQERKIRPSAYLYKKLIAEYQKKL